MTRTDRPSRRKTGRLVRAVDRAATATITAGGLAVVAAMLGICLFLVVTAAPLLRGATVEERSADQALAASIPGLAAASVRIAADGSSALVLSPDGSARSLALTDGGLSDAATAASSVTASAFDAASGVWLLGSADGSLRTARVRDAAGDAAPELTPGRELDLEGEGPVLAVATAAVSERRRFLAALRADGTLAYAVASQTPRLDGGPPNERFSSWSLFTPPPAQGESLFVTADGNSVLRVAPDGTAVRYGPERPGRGPLRELERVRLVPEDRAVTAVAPAVGGLSLMVGDSAGTVGVWSLATEADTPDGQRLVRAHAVAVSDAPVVRLAAGLRDRTFAASAADGSIVVANATSQKILARLAAESPAVALGLSPPLDALLALTADGRVRAWSMQPGHPEASAVSLFTRVQYEGYARPAFVYQSTGSAGAEPKLSLVPLIWGTIKATIVAMILAVPLAICAAIYSSEFLSHEARRIVKPAIELMASLPSVVLGFVAAMLVAPLVRDWLPQILVSIAVLPLVVLLAAQSWALMPRAVTDRVRGGTRVLAVVTMLLVLGVVVTNIVGRVIDATLFAPPDSAPPGTAGGVRAWLDGGFGSAMPGWLLLLMVPAAAVVWGAQRLALGQAPSPAAGLLRLVAGLGLSALLAVGAAWALTALGYDPRDSIFGPFSQRNTLVVGIIMGFAVIPIIYTISDDALRAVPGALRAASLGCGATPWQTTVRVVLPVAASGIFSACMVGLGRAVGETMIVLMATGNTPEMSLNIFSGFRTLAANIAVELPEAPRGGTHYRVLFLCGLVLFVMTLAINTTAEIVRQRVRRRTAQL
jgi:phosphate transport system permease protein